MIRFAPMYFLAFGLDRYNLSLEIPVTIGYPIDLQSSGLDNLGFQVICIGRSRRLE
jgi:hypothetical protein